MKTSPDAPLAGAPLRHLLVATDLSRAARSAVNRAALLPLASDATVEIVHVVPDEAQLRQAGGKLAAVRSAVQEEARRLVAQRARRHLPNVEVTVTITSGSPFGEIIRRAEKVSPDLIVVGRHGGGGFRTLLLGSTAERVARGKAAPVLVVAPPVEGLYSRPAIALDPTSAFLHIVSFALRVLPAGLKRLELLSAFEVVFEGYMRAGGVSAQSIREMRRRHARECRELLAKGLEGLVPGEARVVTRVRRGDPRFIIGQMTEKGGYDLVALGTNARGAVARFLLGSVAVEVMRSSKGDVLVVPP